MKSRTRGFSMVEVALAVGVLAFALVTIVALLPIGLKANKSSFDESRAVNILTALEADLRCSASNGSSQLYQLSTPYRSNSFPPIVFNTLAADVVHTKGCDENETPLPPSPGLPYQVSVVYTKVPAAGSLLPIEARLIVSWPCLSSADSTSANLASPSRVDGYVESYVTFPAP